MEIIPEAQVIEAPLGLALLSQMETDTLYLLSHKAALSQPFKRCAFATLVSVRGDVKYMEECERALQDFRISIKPNKRGVSLLLENAPKAAFVRHQNPDGTDRYELILGAREHLFAVLRDLIFTHSEVHEDRRLDLATPQGVANAIFHILRKAEVFVPGRTAPLVVCWGGHRIQGPEYKYTSAVGYQLGLRNLDICTGSGPGAMMGPMEGATIAHAKQRIIDGRYIGITEPGIISAEPPNPIVNTLIVMPDIEKRLEAFVSLGHGYVIFPGGVGTLEEIFYILAIFLDPANDHLSSHLRFILTGPESSKDYLHLIHRFIGTVLGEPALNKFVTIIGSPEAVGIELEQMTAAVRAARIDDVDYFCWALHIDWALRNPFETSHESAKRINLGEERLHLRAAEFRNFFSLIVAGSIKADCVQAIQEIGSNYKIPVPTRFAPIVEELMAALKAQERLKSMLPGNANCFDLIPV